MGFNEKLNGTGRLAIRLSDGMGKVSVQREVIDEEIMYLVNVKSPLEEYNVKDMVMTLRDMSIDNELLTFRVDMLYNIELNKVYYVDNNGCINYDLSIMCPEPEDGIYGAPHTFTVSNPDSIEADEELLNDLINDNKLHSDPDSLAMYGLHRPKLKVYKRG